MILLPCIAGAGLGFCAWLASCHLVSYQPSQAQVRGSHVLVTGGSSGIGLATARRCLQEGAAHVVIVGSSLRKLQAAEAELRAAMQASSTSSSTLLPHQRVTALAADVSQPEFAQAVQRHIQQHGAVDILVASAGVTYVAMFEDIPVEKFERLMQVNYLGVVHSIRGVLPAMKAQKKGRIVIVSSMLGQAGMVGYTCYAPTKFALRGLAESLSMELSPCRVGVTLVHPPNVDTPMYAEEMKTKPLATKLADSDSGLFTADHIAKDILRSIPAYTFSVQTGFDGVMLGLGTAGMAPAGSMLEVAVQVLTAGVLRFVGLLYLKKFYRICGKCARQGKA